MPTQALTRVGILFGGPSAEHEVSCASALALVRALAPERFQPVVVGITRDRQYRLLPGDIVRRLARRPVAARAIDDRVEVLGRHVELRPAPAGGALVTAFDTGEVLAELDVVFPALHGPFGEDGVLQGVLESLGVPYVGCGVAASAVGMDKVAMKRALRAEGLPVTPYVSFDEVRWRASADPAALVEGLRRPLFVKPARMGSSLGVSRVVSDDELRAAVEHALGYDSVVLVEQGVTARELECGVLGGWQPAASAVGEVVVSGGWFDYAQKYLAETDPMIVPALVPPPVAARVAQLSVRAFQAIGCWGLARVDLLYDESSGALLVNELNTMPGFTAHSMYPKVWAAVGVGYAELVERLIGLAFERQAAGRRGSVAELSR